VKGFLALVAVHVTAGYVLAVGFEGFLWGDSRWAAVRGAILWMALAGGAWALHSAFDRAPGPAPSGPVMEIGVATMAAALVLSFTLTPGYRVSFALCFLLSGLYAIPPVRLAGRGAWDLATVALGFGFLTPYAGVAATGKSLDLVSGLALLGFVPLAAGFRALAMKPDGQGSLWLAIWGAAAAFGLWLIAWLLRGAPWYVPAGALLGLISLAIAFAAWMRVLLPWRRHHEAMSPAQHQRGLVQGAIAWIVTDGAIVAAFGL
jgi:hypothetical protein